MIRGINAGAIDAFVFDFDGVLADSQSAHEQARAMAFAESGIEVDELIHTVAHKHGSHPEAIIGWILKECGFVAIDSDVATDPFVGEVVALKTAYYQELSSQGLPLVPGADVFVRWITSSPHAPTKAAIATTARKSEVDAFLKLHDLEGSFDAIVTREDTPAELLKPDGFVYNETVVRLGVEPRKTMALEDTPIGLRAAKAAGLIAIGIPTTHDDHELWSFADYVAMTFNQVQSYVTTLGVYS